jgi:glutamate-1-semialdehyde 2,1-aminomutase
MAAGLKTLELISAPGFFDALGEKTRYLMDGLAQRATKAGIAFTTNRVGGMFGLFFTAQPVSSLAQASACDVERFKRFFHGMLEEGVYLAPSAFEAGFVSAAHDQKVLDETLAAAERVFAKIQ